MTQNKMAQKTNKQKTPILICVREKQNSKGNFPVETAVVINSDDHWLETISSVEWGVSSVGKQEGK